MQPRFLVTCWPGSGNGPLLTEEQIKAQFKEATRVIHGARNAHQAAVMHLHQGCTSDGCLSEELLGPWRPENLVHE